MSKISQENIFLATSILVKNSDVICYNDNFYRYKDGIWVLIKHSGDIDSTIFDIFIDNNLTMLATCNINEVKTLSRAITYKQYKQSIIDKSDFLKRTWEINLKSNIYNMQTQTSSPFTRESFVFQSLPFNFIENEQERREYIQKTTGTWKQFLKSVFTYQEYIKPDGKYDPEAQKTLDDTIDFVQEWFGYSLLPFNPLEKSLIMVGEGRNGKGVMNEIWKTIVGKENYTTLTLEEINDPKQLWRTRNKLLNFSDDLNSNIQLDTGIAKSAASNEEVTSDQKFKDQDQFYFTAKMIMACNELPYLKKVGPAVKERFQILTFPNVFTQEKGNLNINLKSELKEESEGIFNWAVEGLIRLYKNQQFTIPSTVSKDIDSYMEDYDLVRLWLKEDEDIITNDPNAIELPKKLYGCFLLFSGSSGKQAISKPKFYKKLEILGYKKKKIDGYEYFVGIKIKTGNSWIKGH